jgi:HSP20 family protein
MFSLIPWRKEKHNGGALQRADAHPLNRIRDEFDALFDHFFGNWPSFGLDPWGGQSPWGLDLQENDKDLTLRVEAPGFEVEDFDVRVSGNVLTVRAERKQEGKENGSGYSERRFERSLTLPVGVEVDKAEARYRNGVLELRLPKIPEAQAKRIAVQAS